MVRVSSRHGEKGITGVRLIILSIGLAVPFAATACGNQVPSDDSSAGGTGDTNLGGGGGGGGGAGDGGSSVPPSELPAVCDVPDAWVLPGVAKVVGTGTKDSCTEDALRSAVEGGGSITFDCGSDAVTIAVSEPISVHEETVLDGQGKVTLDGGGKTRILVVETDASLSARGLRFVGGRTADTQDGDGVGGAISGQWKCKVEIRECEFEQNVGARGGGAVAVWAGSSLLVASSRFRKNSSWYGGAIYSLLSDLQVFNSEFSENENRNEVVDGNGMGSAGAIGTDGASADTSDDVGGIVEICGSVFSKNVAYGTGGAAFLWVYPPDKVILDRVLVSGNEARKDKSDISGAGGMRVDNGSIILRRSTFVGNMTFGNGGALSMLCSPDCTIENSTVVDNSTEEANGGAFFFLGQGATVRNTTMARNYAGGHGGGIFGGSPTLENSIFLDNETGNPWGQARNCFETSSGHDVLQWRSASGDAGGDTCLGASEMVVADPLLGELGDNGGSTPTMSPQSGSGALSKGTACPQLDQRGESRDAEICDLGSVEVP